VRTDGFAISERMRMSGKIATTPKAGSSGMTGQEPRPLLSVLYEPGEVFPADTFVRIVSVLDTLTGCIEETESVIPALLIDQRESTHFINTESCADGTK
jgi:hypothetical protein